LAAHRDTHGGAVSVEDAARRLGISPRGVARLVAGGELSSLRVGRRRLIPVQAIDRLLVDGITEPPNEPPRRLRQPRP
jgi:excisionase family DNA binding protein